MKPVGALVRGVGSPDGAAGTRATSGGVESTGPGWGVEIHDVVQNGCLRTTLMAVRLRLRDQFRMGKSPLDHRLCQRQRLGDRRGQRVRDFRWKRLIVTLADDELCSLIFFKVCARMLSCSTACLSVPFSSMEYELTVERIFTGRSGPSRSAPGWRAPTCPRKDSSGHTATNDPAVSLRHRAYPCALTGPPLRARSSRPAADPSPSLPSRRSCLLGATAPSPGASPGDGCRATHAPQNG
jgi:hypothetical protein